MTERDPGRPHHAHAPQLTLRAVTLGAALGLVTGVSNLYVGLKTGLALGVSVTAGVLGWALGSALLRLRLVRRPLGLLEASSMVTTASAAGASTGVLLTSSIAALVMLTGQHLPWWQLSLWVISVALLGALLGFLLRPALIVREALPFPTGTAVAEALRGLGGDDGQRSRLLWLALATGAALKWLTAGAPLTAGWGLPAELPTPTMVAGVGWLGVALARTWSIELSAAILGTGALIGWHVGWSLLLGAILCFGLLAPIGQHAGFIAAADYPAIVAWSVWPGVTCMIVGNVEPLLRGWGSLTARLRDATRLLGPAGGLALALVAATCVLLQRLCFAVPLPVAILGVLLACVLATVVARVAGETDVVLTGPLAKISQVGCGALLIGTPAPALIAASVSAGAGSACAGLLADFKTGQLLGAEPRRQFAAHLLGLVLAGVVLVPVFTRLLVPDPAALGTATWPAPAAQAWRTIAVALGGGWTPDRAVVLAIAAAAGIGVLLLVLTRLRPRLRPWLPHPLGLGLGFILPASQSVTFFLGALAALLIARRRPAWPTSSLLVVASGLIAGESLVGVAVALLGARA